MRKTYYQILKTHFHKSLLHTRDSLGLTQSEMAEKLAMDDRSYNDLDHGKSCCSSVTPALYPAKVCDDPQAFLEVLRHEFES